MLSKSWLSRLVLLSVVLLVGVPITGCSGGTHSSGEMREITMAPLSEFPQEMWQAPVVVRQAYQFSVANPEIVSQVPCYCGCSLSGHMSNYDCYVKDSDASGNISFDGHGLGCSICVDITQDTMRLYQEGKDLDEIRTYVDRRYSKYGPPTGP